MIARGYYYLLSSLPPVPSLGEAAPVSLAEVREKAAEFPPLAELVDAALLEHDLLTRQSFLTDGEFAARPATLSTAQLRGDEPLPAFLRHESLPNRPVGDDALWETYFRYTAGLADRRGSSLLRCWVGFEVSLRNALATARARKLELRPEDYLVAPELSANSADTLAIVARWAAASHPLAAMRVLDQARWEWLAEQNVYFTFAADEVIAYVLQLKLLHRWQAIGVR